MFCGIGLHDPKLRVIRRYFMKPELIELPTVLPNELIIQLTKKLQAVIRNRPMWARWIARNADGTYHWFEKQPEYNLKKREWRSTGKKDNALKITE